MTDTTHLGLPHIEVAQAQKHVTHNEALTILDALVMLSVLDRDLSAPPGSPAEGDRYLVKAPGSGGFAGKDGQIAHYVDGGWSFYAPHTGWTCYVEDEGALIAWDGDSWEPALQIFGGGTAQNLSLLGVGTTADATNPFSAKLNNALWTAKTVAEGGDGNLRYKLSKESAANTLSFLFQNAYSGRAEIGLTGDDDFHFKVSADGSAWTDALVIDQTSGSIKLNSGLFIAGDLSPAPITADQNDYGPAGLSSASVLRLSSDASRNVTGLQGGADGRVLTLINVGSNPIVLKNQSASSSAANRFLFGFDVTLAANQCVPLWYDATSGYWRLLLPFTTGVSAGNVPVLDSGAQFAGAILNHSGCGRLAYVSATQIKFSPYNGDRVKIAGVWYQIPSGGITAANTIVYVNGASGQNLAASTLYYVYLFNNSGTLTVDFSTTARATDTTAGNVGVEIKSGDNTRTLIGLVRTDGSSQFADNDAQRFVLSYFNRSNKACRGSGGTHTSASTTYVEISSSRRLEFLTWVDESVFGGLTCYMSNDTAGFSVYLDVAYDGTTGEGVITLGTSPVATYAFPGSTYQWKSGLSEGYHYMTPIGRVDGHTGSWNGLKAHCVVRG